MQLPGSVSVGATGRLPLLPAHVPPFPTGARPLPPLPLDPHFPYQSSALVSYRMLTYCFTQDDDFLRLAAAGANHGGIV